MDTHSIRRQGPAPVALATALLAAFAACSGNDGAAPARTLDYRGVDVDRGLPSALQLRFDDDSLQGASLAFGGERQCRLRLRRSTDGGTPNRFEIVDSSGGAFCDGLYPGRLDLARADRGWRLHLPDVPGPAPVLGPAEAFRGDRQGVGRWEGTTRPASAPAVPVAITVGSLLPGERDSHLRFGGDRSCGLPLQYQGELAGLHGFIALAAPSGGGYCDRLVGRSLQLRFVEGRVSYRIDPPDPDCPEACELVRGEP